MIGLDLLRHRIFGTPARLDDPPVWSAHFRMAALSLAAARLRHIAGTAWSTNRYLNIELPEESADERCHHPVSQGRAPLSQTKSAPESGYYQDQQMMTA
jgi:hypothetical protein